MTESNGKPHITFPPGRGSYSIPTIQQALGIYNVGLARLFRNPDEAYINDRTAAETMLNDLTIMEPLNSRIMATALLPWHIQPEDARQPEQVQVAKTIQGILEECPEFVKLRSSLLWGIWYGSAGIQVRYRFDYRKGRRLVIEQFQPIHGDSIRWRWDEPGRIGIMVYAAQLGGIGTKEIPWISSDVGPVHLLTPEEREQYIIHKHLLAMGSYFDPQKIGLSQGVGLRNYVYWMWRQKQEMLAELSEYLERWGLGATIANYPLGNPEFQAQAESIAQSMDFSQVITWPKHPNGEDTGGLERIPPETAGIDNYMTMIDGYYSKLIRQFISGASIGDNGDVTIIGQDDSHENNFSRLIRFDAINLADTLTEQLVKVIQRWSFPDTANRFRCKFVINVDRPDPASFMQAAKLFWDMGGSLSEAQVRNELRLSEPMPGEKALEQPQAPPMGGMGLDPHQGEATNPFSGEDPNAKPQLPQPGRGEGEWDIEQGPEGGEMLVNDETGAVRYSGDEPATYSADSEGDDFPWEDHHGAPNARLNAGNFHPDRGYRGNGQWNPGGLPQRQTAAQSRVAAQRADKVERDGLELARSLGRKGIKLYEKDGDAIEQYAKGDWTRIEDGPKGGKRWKNKISGKISRSDPTRGSSGKAPEQGKGKAEAPKKKQSGEDTVREATAAFTEKDQAALDRVAEKLRAAKGQRGGLGVAGLNAIAKAFGLKGAGKLKKNSLIEALIEKLGVAKKEGPIADFDRRIATAAEAQRVSGISFLDRLSNQILSFRNDEQYKAAIADLEENGHDKSGKPVRRPEAENTIKAKRKQILDELKNNANPNNPSDELRHALKSIAQQAGSLTPAEAIDLAIEGGKLDKITPPQKEAEGILPDDLKLAQTHKPKETPKKKQRDYLDRITQKPLKVRNRFIASAEKKTGVPFTARVVNRVINEKILSPEARSKFEGIKAKLKETGIQQKDLPDRELRFFKDYEAGERYKDIQTKLLRANKKGVEHHLNGDDASFLRNYRGAILTRLQFEDGLTFGAHDISNILEDLDSKGLGSLRYDEFVKRAKNTNVFRDRDKYQKG
jgi:phage gp29-like protein